MVNKSKLTVIVLSILFCFSACGENAVKTKENVAKATKESEYIAGTTENQTEGIYEKPAKLVIKGEDIKTQSTLTGYKSLPGVHYEESIFSADKGLSNEKICHSHGPASNGDAHYTVKEFQNIFDKYNALTLDNKSSENVVYLTFDCGYEYENITGSMLDTLKEKNVPAAFFCTLHHIKTEPELITRMIKEGHIVGNHSATHPSFAAISRTQMINEIEECENYLREKYGYCSYFFRFPSGEYTENALDLVNALGYKSIFWSLAYDDWDTENSKGSEYAEKTVLERLHPGAVILLHSVSRDNQQALGSIIDKVREKGYEFKSLEDYPFA